MLSFQPLRNLLTRRGISFRQLARDCGISSNASVALNNDQSVRLSVIVTICNYLDASIEEVVVILKP